MGVSVDKSRVITLACVSPCVSPCVCEDMFLLFGGSQNTAFPQGRLLPVKTPLPELHRGKIGGHVRMNEGNY